MVKKNKTKIIQNQVTCNLCKETIFSTHVHDFKYCKCGNISVDGGLSYFKRSGNVLDKSSYTDESITISVECYDECIEILKWAKDTGRNEFGQLSAIMRTLNKYGYLKNV